MAMALNVRWKKVQILSKKRMKDNGKFGYVEPPTMILTSRQAYRRGNPWSC